MARQIAAQAQFAGERISNDDMAKLESFFITNVVSIDTSYGPSYVVSIRVGDEKPDDSDRIYYSFMAPGLKQRDDMAAMFEDSREEIGPVRLDKLPTKQGRSVWVFSPVDDETAF